VISTSTPLETPALTSSGWDRLRTSTSCFGHRRAVHNSVNTTTARLRDIAARVFSPVNVIISRLH